MTASTTRTVRLLAALAVAGVLLVVADGSEASAPAGCHGLSPASAVGCPADVYDD